MIEGKVARVLNERELAINKGARDGVKVGMRFAVLDAKAEEAITDPDTGEPLGSVYRPKARVEIVEVQDRMSVGRTYQRIGGRGLDLASLFSQYQPPRWKTLRTDDAEFPPIEDSESFIRRGDPVRQLRDEAT